MPETWMIVLASAAGIVLGVLSNSGTEERQRKVRIGTNLACSAFIVGMTAWLIVEGEYALAGAFFGLFLGCVLLSHLVEMAWKRLTTALGWEQVP
jgi:hypothetical protein